ncbi:hypothetical protein PMAYCL1PPCAC_28159 [Pristionchus mayeri]|uniref:PHD-type domain-containing protein n=1 Tax=Pristionchus mayeri TaxID=1317129 RepID=A0AAN5D7Q6_9BILA|nr:hypothetical protein PMAYCL1PPCAC_28159 [Pristionchus mayeri]
MSDQLDSSVEIIEPDGSSSSSSAAASNSSTKVVAGCNADPPAEVMSLRGNALYARLAVLMGSAVSTEDAIAEMREMSKQIVARKRAAGVAELWDAGEEVGETGGGPPGSNNRPPPKRIGPPAAVIAGASNRLHASPLVDKRGRPAAVHATASSSGSEESQDSTAVDRAKASASEIPKTANKLCIMCHDAGSALLPMLTCSVCTLPTHAMCAKPPVEKEELSSARFVFTCSSCSRRPRSESPKPSLHPQRTTIQMIAPHDMKRKKTNEDLPKLAKFDEARRKRLEGADAKRKKTVEEVL